MNHASEDPAPSTRLAVRAIRALVQATYAHARSISAVVAVMLALTTLGPGNAIAGRQRPPISPSAGSASESTLPAAPCAPHALPDGDACVQLPDEDEGEPEAESAVGGHHDPRGRWVVYDEIPKRPERPGNYDAYQYPVPCTAGCVFSGYDLDRPDELQRRGLHLSHVGHGGLDIAAPRGEPVALPSLEHQQGDAEVIYVGPLFGTTVVTRHTLREAGRLRDYVVLYCHLEGPAAGLADRPPGSSLREGDIIGFVGDTGSHGLVHLHLEVRRVRDGVDAKKLSPGKLVDDAETVVCDPRNVLKMR